MIFSGILSFLLLLTILGQTDFWPVYYYLGKMWKNLFFRDNITFVKSNENVTSQDLEIVNSFNAIFNERFNIDMLILAFFESRYYLLKCYDYVLPKSNVS